jgi:hypothetical protein
MVHEKDMKSLYELIWEKNPAYLMKPCISAMNLKYVLWIRVFTKDMVPQ